MLMPRLVHAAACLSLLAAAWVAGSPEWTRQGLGAGAAAAVQLGHLRTLQALVR